MQTDDKEDSKKSLGCVTRDKTAQQSGTGSRAYVNISHVSIVLIFNKNDEEVATIACTVIIFRAAVRCISQATVELQWRETPAKSSIQNPQ